MICPLFTGGDWSRDGKILFASGNSVFLVPQAGGTPKPVPTFDPAAGAYLEPRFLPDGRHIIFASRQGGEGQGIYLGTLDAKTRKRLAPSNYGGQYAPPPPAGGPGHLLFLRERTLLAQPLDSKTFDPAGDAFPVAEPVANNGPETFFSVSASGVLAYRTGIASADTQLMWFDRDGKASGAVGPPGLYNDLALSPDGTRVAVSQGDPGSYDLWLIDIARGVPTRFTFDSTHNWDPVWSPDGTRLAFSSGRVRQGIYNLYSKPSSGLGQEEPLVKPGSAVQRPKDWSADGKFLLFVQGGVTNAGLWVLPLEGDRKPTPYLQTQFLESQGQFSPGLGGPRWVAYISNESGRSEVYVQSFPAGAGKYQISSGGGAQPRWRRDGKELFYLSSDSKLMAVDVKTAPKFEFGVPKPLFHTHVGAGGGANTNFVFRYDVALDGKRFLFVSPGEAEENSSPVNVELNWLAGTRK